MTNERYVETREEIEEELVNHFKEVMMEDKLNRWQDISNITQLLPTVIFGEQNEILLKQIEIQEVEDALKYMTLGKALDRMASPLIFFHYF